MKQLLIFIVLAVVVKADVAIQSYVNLKNEIKSKREQFQKEYTVFEAQQRDSLIEVASEYIFNSIRYEIYPHWYGTPWEFYGRTRVPQKGSIACGYFVTHVLSDAGFNIPYVKWAQSASEYFIKKLSALNIARFSNKPVSTIKEYLIREGDGLYLVGLDCHVGFIVVEGESMKFVHSSYYQPDIGVISEDLDSWNPLRDSNYRVIGKLLSKQMVINWIEGVQYR